MTIERTKTPGRAALLQLLDQAGHARVGLIGDLCLDAYWLADMKRSELSRETPHYPLPIVEERMYPGAGGNVAANIAALRPAALYVIGAIGRDWRGDALERALHVHGVETGCIVRSDKIITNAYCKPLRKGISDTVYEDPRIDFANDRDCPREVERQILENLDAVAQKVDALCVSDQFSYGIITPAVRAHLIALAGQGLPVIVDSRDRICEYTGAILKPNELEGRRAVGRAGPIDGDALEEYALCAEELARRNRARVCMTVGARGSLLADENRVVHIPAHPLKGPLDICGAGDTFLSAFTVMTAAGAPAEAAAWVGGMASEITIRKIGVTGTASREELLTYADVQE